MIALRRGVLALGLLVVCHAAAAFGPKTHLWIGTQILGDLRDQCSVKLVSRTYRVAPDLCEAIAANPASFSAGVLGPDVYPDLISGQNTVHSGVRDGWETAEFLEHVVSSANTPASRAYAAGYLVHAAGDVFGHSYVNAYAGDVWNIGDERAVELRHSAIEKYIDSHLPPSSSDATTFRAPADFVRDALVHNVNTQAQYRRAGFARHLAAMTSVKSTIDDLAATTESITRVVPDILAKYVELGTTLTAQLADGEAELAVASAALEAPKAAAAAQHVILDNAAKVLAEAVSAVVQHEHKLTDLATQAQAQQRAAAAASAAARRATTAANELRTQLSDLESQIRTAPPRIVVTVCRNVAEGLCDTVCSEGSTNPLCELCKVPRGVCMAVERVNDEYQRLNEQITDAKQRLLELDSAAAEETAKASSASADADALLQQQAAEDAAGPGLAATRATAEAAYAVADRQYELVANTVESLQRRMDDLRGKAEATRQRLVDARAIGDQLRNLASNLNLLSHLFRNWQAGIDHAGSAFVTTSERIAQRMLDGHTHLFSEYGRWLACDGAVYLAEPYQLADVPCAAKSAVQQLNALLHDMADVVLPEPLHVVRDQLDALRHKIDTDLKAALAGATLELVRFVSDRHTADLVDLLLNPEHATRAKLDEVLAASDSGKGSEVLVFDNGGDLIDRDLGLEDGALDPNEFAALSSAVTLAKLSLLDQAEMGRLVVEIGGSEAQAAYDAGGFDIGRSILISAVRSLDGNEQWQPYGLPYPRPSGGGAPANAADRHYGFGPRDARRQGLPLFVDPVLRERVFLRLFPKQIHGEVAKHPAMAPGRYAFPICESNPFPVTFLPTGDPAPFDDRCPAQPPPTQAR